MENASRALLLAAGILLGLILLTSVMYIYNTIRDSTEAKYQLLSEEQLLKENAEFESYDKKYMYGTDVITVLNKAIDLNKQNYSAGDFQIDITFKLLSDVENYIIPYQWDFDTKKYTRLERTNKTTPYKGYELKGNEDIKRAISYSILNESHLTNIEAFLKTQVIKSEIRINEKYGRDGDNKYEKILTYYEMYYTGFSDFKRKIFTCVDIEYDTFTGKVKAMHFEEVNPDEEQKKNNEKT